MAIINKNKILTRKFGIKEEKKKTLFFKPRSQRLASIISIRSPALFKRSIIILRRGGLGLTERRALVLAQNRAKAQLKRRNLSIKERKQFTIISKIKIPKPTKA